MQTTMTAKGRVTVPQSVRDRLGLKPGHPVRFARNAAGETVIAAVEGSTPETVLELDEAELERRQQDMRRRIDSLSALEPLDLGMSTDEFMAMIRDPIDV